MLKKIMQTSKFSYFFRPSQRILSPVWKFPFCTAEEKKQQDKKLSFKPLKTGKPSEQNGNKYKLPDIMRELAKVSKTLEVQKVEENFDKLLTLDFGKFKNTIFNLALTLQNLAKLNLGNSKVLFKKRQEVAVKVMSICLENFEAMNQLDILMLFWSCVKMDVYSEELVKKCLEYFQKSFSALSEQDMVNYIFSVAKIAERKEKLGVVQQHLREMKPELQKKVVEILSETTNQQHITNLIWSAERLKLYDQNILAKCEEALEKESVTFNDINFGIILNSFVHMNYITVDNYGYFAQEFYKRQSNLKTKTFVSILRALFLSNAGDFFEVMKNSNQYIRRNLSSFTSQELIAMLPSIAVTRDESRVAGVIIDECQKNLVQFRHEDLCKLIWCMAVLNDFSRIDLWYKISDRFTERDFSRLGVIDLHQFSQGLLSLILYLKKAEGVNLQKLKDLEMKYEKVKQLVQNQTLVDRQKNFAEEKEGIFSVYKTLQDLGFRVVPECIAEIYNIDFVLFDITKERLLELEKKLLNKEINLKNSSDVVLDIKKEIQVLKESDDKSKFILMELNGRHHYIGQTNRLKGSTYLKTSQLKALGYNYVPISHQKLFHISGFESANERGLALIDLMMNSLSEN